MAQTERMSQSEAAAKGLEFCFHPESEVHRAGYHDPGSFWLCPPDPSLVAIGLTSLKNVLPGGGVFEVFYSLDFLIAPMMGSEATQPMFANLLGDVLQVIGLYGVYAHNFLGTLSYAAGTLAKMWPGKRHLLGGSYEVFDRTLPKK